MCEETEAQGQVNCPELQVGKLLSLSLISGQSNFKDQLLTATAPLVRGEVSKHGVDSTTKHPKVK